MLAPVSVGSDHMSSVSLAHKPSPPVTDLLADLRDAHEKVLTAIDDMETATQAAEPGGDLYPRARWRLSQASRHRRVLVDAICSELLKRVSAEEVKAIEALRADGERRLRASAAHVRTWTMESINRDWRAYCRASAVIRASMRERIASEKAVLDPLLSQYRK